MLGEIHPLMLRGLFGRFTSFVGSQLAPCRLKTCVSYCCSKKVLWCCAPRACPAGAEPPRRRRRQSRIIGGRSDLHAELGQHGTDRLDSEPVLIFRDERYKRGSRGSSSPAKQAEAAFKISVARRNSRFSRSSSR